MTIWTIIKRFQYKQFWELFVLSIKYPLYIYPTLKATAKSFQIAKKEFPKAHGKKGKANAFRHAFWNAYICYKCTKWSKNRQRIITWAELITAKHEELSPNEPLDTAMDLHNNKVGRIIFHEQNFENVYGIIECIKKELENAKKVSIVSEIEECVDTLIYIREDESIF
jgi:hypothetical protein